MQDVDHIARVLKLVGRSILHETFAADGHEDVVLDDGGVNFLMHVREADLGGLETNRKGGSSYLDHSLQNLAHQCALGF